MTAAGGVWSGARVRLLLGFLAFANIVMTGVILWALHGPGGSGTMMDFGALWAAGRMAAMGNAAAAYDIAAITAVQSEGLGRAYEREMAWLYPPILQLGLTPFGMLPLLVAQALWTGLTLAAYLTTCWRILPDRGTMLAALAPTTVVLLMVNGQTGFIVAAFAGMAMLGFVRAVPAQGGPGLGLLAIKPQVVVLLPLPFLLSGPSLALAVAAATVAVLAALATVAFGMGVWPAFLEGIGIGGRDLGRSDILSNQATLRAALVALGASPTLAWAGQGAMALAALGLFIAHRALPREALAALALYAGAAATPRVMDYDLTILVIGGLFHARRIISGGSIAGEQAVLAFVLLLPMADLLTGLPLNWLAAPMLIAALIAGERSRAGQSASATGPSSG
ncbi:MAG: glycosyltransferase family 87 protein [Pseudomonadota bacterium]